MTQVVTAKEFVLALENRPGTLGEVAAALGKANVNVTGFSLETIDQFGVLRIVTSDPAKAESWLKTTSRSYRTNEVVLVPVANNPGELGRISEKLAKSGVNIRATYATVTPTGPQIAFSVDDVAAAKKVLS